MRVHRKQHILLTLLVFLSRKLCFLAFVGLNLSSVISFFLPSDRGNNIHSSRATTLGHRPYLNKLLKSLSPKTYCGPVLSFNLSFLLASPFEPNLHGIHIPQRHSYVFAHRSPCTCIFCFLKLPQSIFVK